MKNHHHHISSDYLNLKTIEKIIEEKKALSLSKKSIGLIQKCRSYLDKKIQESDDAFYGINTGFGDLHKVSISKKELETLQSNLVKSHAVGMGEEVPSPVIKLMLLLKIQSLAYGHSGIRQKTIKRIIDFYNEDILPVVYQLGSLGASGDLAPLAHLSLPLLGEGEVYWKGEKKRASEVLEFFGWQPIKLQAKEGLALLNGTQFSAAYGVWCLLKSQRLLELANLCAAMSVDAFDCNLSPFDERLHLIRPHQGQIKTAKSIRSILEGSQIAQQIKKHVQDPYSFRCVPQVHGASYDAIQYIQQLFLTEINSVTDNPNIFPDDDVILSGGNFHAQPLALGLDYLAIAIAELGNISERRVFQLISGQRGLPPFLTKCPGLHSGLMMPQYTAASIVSQNKQLCSPASVDSIVSSNGQEDHVSMAANAATKAYRVVQNVERLLAIEFMVAAQALHFRLPLVSSKMIVDKVEKYRAIVPILEEDRVLSEDLNKTLAFLSNCTL